MFCKITFHHMHMFRNCSPPFSENSCGLSHDLMIMLRLRFIVKCLGNVTHRKPCAVVLLFGRFNEQFHPESKQTLILIVRGVVLNVPKGVDQLDVASS